MKEVQDRVVQFSNRYKLTNAETGEVLGTFDFDEVTGTVQQVGTMIDKELFDSIAADLAARVKYTDKYIEVDDGSHAASSSLLVGGMFLRLL